VISAKRSRQLSATKNKWRIASEEYPMEMKRAYLRGRFHCYMFLSEAEQEKLKRLGYNIVTYLIDDYSRQRIEW